MTRRSDHSTVIIIIVTILIVIVLLWLLKHHKIRILELRGRHDPESSDDELENFMDHNNSRHGSSSRKTNKPNYKTISNYPRRIIKEYRKLTDMIKTKDQDVHAEENEHQDEVDTSSQPFNKLQPFNIADVVLPKAHKKCKRKNCNSSTCNRQKSPCQNTYCSKELICFQRVFSAKFPQEITYSISYPGALDSRKTPNIQSYLNTSIIDEGSRTPNLLTRMNPSGVYSCWCVDVHDFISPGTEYKAQLVSILDPHINQVINAMYKCTPNNPIYLAYLGGILYIFNEAQNYQAIGYSYQDIQVAIWTLLFTIDPANDTPIDDGGALSYNAANVAVIINAAIAAQIAYNKDGDACTHLITTKIMGLIAFNIDPITSSTGCNQILCQIGRAHV